MTLAQPVRIEPRIRGLFSYPVIFTRQAFRAGNTAFADALGACPAPYRRVAAFIDENVLHAWPELPKDLAACAAVWAGSADRVEPVKVVPGGEGIKNDADAVFAIARALLRPGICRHTRIVIVGGGAVLDAVGFAASLVHRGLRVVRVPTTVLAQNDAGVGVKNGINMGGAKNGWGVFHPPHAVLEDFAFLDTLTDRDWHGGIAEAWKVALLKDAAFFETLCATAGALGRRDAPAMETLIVRCAQLHLDHIAAGGDPFELGSARPLDFGHWSAHALEVMSDYRIGHGQAVAAGIALDTAYAMLSGWVAERTFSRLCTGLSESGLPIWYQEMEQTDAGGRPLIFEGIEAFRAHLGGELQLTFPGEPGTSRDESQVDFPRMIEALNIVALRKGDRNE